MNPFNKLWFWLLIISLIGFIIALIFLETQSETVIGHTSTPMWIWIMFGVAGLFFIVSFVLYCITLSNHHRDLEIAEACGELPPPVIKKKRECPKTECKQKTITECYDRKSKKICQEKVDLPDTVTVSTTTVSNPIDNSASRGLYSTTVTQTNPLNNLAPPQNNYFMQTNPLSPPPPMQNNTLSPSSNFNF